MFVNVEVSFKCHLVVFRVHNVENFRSLDNFSCVSAKDFDTTSSPLCAVGVWLRLEGMWDSGRFVLFLLW